MTISSTMWRAAILTLFLLLACCAGTQDFYTAAQLKLNPERQVPQWQVMPGADVVLVFYASESGARESGANEELVLQLDPVVMKPGTYSLDDVGRARRYQRGGQVLTYAASRLSGTLTVRRADDEVFEGTVDLVASDPTIDLTRVGTVKRRLAFDARKKHLDPRRAARD